MDKKQMTYSNVEGGGSLETAFVLFQHRLHLFLQKLVHLNEKFVDRDQLKDDFVISKVGRRCTSR